LKNVKENVFEIKNKILNEKGCYFESNNLEFEPNLFGELFFDYFKKANDFDENGRLKLDDKNILTRLALFIKRTNKNV
jgi:hypothetical protein